MSHFRPDWNRIDHVLLDMDGTVLDLAFDNFFWGELVPQRYALARGLSIEDALAELTPQFRAIEHTLPWYCTDHWSRITGLNLRRLKEEIRERVAFIGGSLEFLQAVKASGRPLWLVTNAHRDSWEVKLEQLGLAPMFDAIVSSHDYGAPKEDPRFWQALQQQHPFTRERALFADDSLPVLRAARDYGVGHIVAMRRPDSTRPARDISEFDAADGLGSLLPL
ncbi:MAG: putative hydrolase of the superfamily [Hydrocarboniphaga sp.]|uniref:GMP/IMP nucleotidase n=1 Tax=Hydrocarboniphaga sp. TaxID=2033016 RepID=UPI00262ED116|nr:GMP/IMP nucleotidase [Hydrocarboniphaga sp.]MDB5972910.1 putative hydrolase of the superfamily [Hydrocarboniphaga sp.]